MTKPRYLLVVAAALALSGCRPAAQDHGADPDGGDPQRGKTAVAHYGCAACHTIPGIRGADALVGPSLEHIASRTYIAGVLQNTRRNMLSWIQNPPAVDDKTAMPKLDVTGADAQDIASYLYTLR
jgi:cytochrome c